MFAITAFEQVFFIFTGYADSIISNSDNETGTDRVMRYAYPRNFTAILPGIIKQVEKDLYKEWVSIDVKVFFGNFNTDRISCHLCDAAERTISDNRCHTGVRTPRSSYSLVKAI